MAAHEAESRTHAQRIPAARTPQSLTAPAAAPQRPARTAGGQEVSPAELHVLATAGRLRKRLGLPFPISGPLLWRAYAAARAVWRSGRRLRRPPGT